MNCCKVFTANNRYHKTVWGLQRVYLIQLYMALQAYMSFDLHRYE